MAGLEQYDFTVFYWVEGDVAVDGTPYRVGLQLAEDSKGNLFSNLNADLAEYRREKSGSTPLPGDSKPGVREPLKQDASASVDPALLTNDDGVNLHIPESLQGDPHGAVFLSPERATIVLFDKADLSTLPHEASHIFPDDLRNMAGSLTRTARGIAPIAPGQQGKGLRQNLTTWPLRL